MQFLFSLKKNQNLVLPGIATILFGLALFVGLFWLSVGTASAQTTYGVDINHITGTVSGYAWSDGLGWILFNGVSFDVLTGDLSGNAQIEEINNVSLDGALSMSGDCVPTCGGYGVNVDIVTGVFSGNAWNELIGWVEFNPVFGGVIQNNAEGPSVSGWAWNDNIGWIQMREPQSQPPPQPNAPGECAASPFNTCRFAWNDNIGWISHNSVDDPSLPAFGVDLDETSGILTGYAWNDFLGWIDFSAVTYSSGDLLGDAQILDLGVDSALSMSGTCGTTCTYGVSIASDGTVSGHAWNDLIGYVDFAPPTGGVIHDNTRTPSMYGWAWNDSYGWISFAFTSYDFEWGVNLDQNANFSGYAWSDNVGWIDYSPAGPFPSTPNYPARWDALTGEVSGWIHILSQGSAGYVLMRDDNPIPYGVTLDIATGVWGGFAWNEDLGWIYYDQPFSPVKTQVTPGPPATPELITPNNCVDLYNIDPSSPLTPTLQWTPYGSLDGSTQQAFELQLSEDPFFAPAGLLINYSSANPPPIFAGDANLYTLGLSEQLAYAKTYYWRVRVQSSNGDWSNWGESGPLGESNCMLTPLHAPPVCAYTSIPSSPIIDEPIQFIDQTQVFNPPSGSPITTIAQWSWDFGDSTTLIGGNPLVHQNPIHTYTTLQTVSVVLGVTDSDGYQCSTSADVTVSRQLPEFKKIIPR